MTPVFWIAAAGIAAMAILLAFAGFVVAMAVDELDKLG